MKTIQLDMFDRPAIKGMVRKDGHHTSILAAERVSSGVSVLQEAVLEAFRLRGTMNDEQLENLEQFKSYAYGTVRKRRTELVQMGKLVEAGCSVNSNGSKVKNWRLP